MSKILIIEDDASNRRIMEVVLRRLNCEVLMAENGADGLVMARKIKPDLILMDVMMPKMSGFDTLTEMRRDDQLSKTPVLVVSAKTSRDERQIALDHGATGFIAKPFHVQDIQEAVKPFLKN